MQLRHSITFIASLFILLTACGSDNVTGRPIKGNKEAPTESATQTEPGGVITYASSFWGGARQDTIELRNRRGTVTLVVTVEFAKAKPEDRFTSKKYKLASSTWKRAMEIIAQHKLLSWKPALRTEPVTSDVSKSLTIRLDRQKEVGHSWHSGSLTPQSAQQVAHLLMLLNRLTEHHSTLHTK